MKTKTETVRCTSDGDGLDITNENKIQTKRDRLCYGINHEKDVRAGHGINIKKYKERVREKAIQLERTLENSYRKENIRELLLGTVVR